MKKYLFFILLILFLIVLTIIKIGVTNISIKQFSQFPDKFKTITLAQVSSVRAGLTPPINARWLQSTESEHGVQNETNVAIIWTKSNSSNLGKQLVMIYSDPQCKNVLKWYTLDKNAESFDFNTDVGTTIYFRIYSFTADEVVGVGTKCSLPLSISSKAENKALYSFNFTNPDSGLNYNLSAYPQYTTNNRSVPRRFLDHVFDYVSNKQTREVLATDESNWRTLYISKDLGLTWNTLTTLPYQVSHAFTTSAGSRIFWDHVNNRLMRLDVSLQSMKATTTFGLPPEYPWYGSQGVGQYKNTIMFGEYFADELNLAKAGLPSKLEARVYRSQDDGLTWEVVFSQTSTSTVDLGVRHFHTLQPDPYYPGHWYLSSGDGFNQSRIWLTKDNGDTWIEITNSEFIAPKVKPQIHRYVSILFEKNSLIWATDDTFGGTGARLVKAKRSEPIKIYATYPITSENVRATIKTPLGYIFLTENVHNITNSDIPRPSYQIGLWTNGGKFKYIGLIPESGSFTPSLSSRYSIDGVFLTMFYPTDSKVTFKGLLRWELRRTSF